jgi:peroxiredoxin-like protein
MKMARFSVNGTWKGNRNGKGKITSEQGLNLDVSAPKELDGPGIGSNPEELLVSASNNCYMITLAAMLSNRQINVDQLEVVSEGVVETIDGKLHFKEIIHHPIISLPKDSDVTEQKLSEIAIRAEKACFISQTLRNNVEFIVKPKIIIGA